MSRSQVLELEGPAAPPRANGELVFEAPWQGRLFGVTLALQERGDLVWDEFRALLIEEIGRSDRDAAGTPYYESWARALERLLERKQLLERGQLEQRTRAYAARPAGHDHDHDHQSAASAASPRTRLRRAPERARHDPAAIRAILDAEFLCHVAVNLDGTPAVIPTLYVAQQDEIFLHGSTANRILRALRDGAEACVTVTRLDALVLARSAFHHSVNYRSVVIYGQAREVTEPAEKLGVLEAMIEHVVPDRWKDVRGPSREELLRTLVLGIPLAEASAKVRDMPPRDDESDLELGCWAGLLPFETRTGEPVPCPELREGIEAPEHVLRYARPWARSESKG